MEAPECDEVEVRMVVLLPPGQNMTWKPDPVETIKVEVVSSKA